MKDPANGVRQSATCPSFGGVVSMFLSERYSHIVDDYRVMLEQDPKYLSYHHTSAALQLQFQLKLEDFPALCIGECIDEHSGECCVVSALREAIRQREDSGGDQARKDSKVTASSRAQGKAK